MCWRKTNNQTKQKINTKFPKLLTTSSNYKLNYSKGSWLKQFFSIMNRWFSTDLTSLKEKTTSHSVSVRLMCCNRTGCLWSDARAPLSFPVEMCWWDTWQHHVWNWGADGIICYTPPFASFTQGWHTHHTHRTKHKKVLIGLFQCCHVSAHWDFFQFKYSSQSVGAIFFRVSHGLHLTLINKAGWCVMHKYTTHCILGAWISTKRLLFSRLCASSDVVDKQNACDWKTVKNVGRTWSKDDEFTLHHPALLSGFAHWKWRFIHISRQRDEPHPQIYGFSYLSLNRTQRNPALFTSMTINHRTWIYRGRSQRLSILKWIITFWE